MSHQKKLQHHLINLIRSANVPSNEILFLHGRIRGLKQQFDLSYTEITRVIIETLNSELSPKTIIVPAYTNVSFRHTGIYHRLYSRSEVGRFSEEVRVNHSVYRTPDPIYSLVDTTDYLENLTNINYETTYGQGSLFNYLNDENYVILNLGLEEIYSTQIHAAEFNAEVPYRYKRNVNGIIYLDDQTHKAIAYDTFILDSPKFGVTYPDWDRKFIESWLIDHGVFHKEEHDGTRLLWCFSQNLTDTLSAALRTDPDLLLSKVQTY